ncbi:MAG: hypothetical protein K2J72_07805 [Oscillospiraceae bacterium]|nr:hypothetical protein [Oscillospiraceae bacterium]
MKKRVITISAIVAGIIILGLFFLWVLLPRIMIYKIVKDFFPSIDKNVEYFTDFSVSSAEEVVTVDNGFVSVSIPKRFKYNEDKAEIIQSYGDADSKESFFFQSSHDSSELNLLDPEKLKDIEGVPKNFDLQEIAEGFESLGNGLPDSAYNTYKCTLLVSKDDYSFWNLKNGVCYAIAAVYKATAISSYDDVYLYERGDIRGIIYATHNHRENGMEWVVFKVYRADDLNTVHTIQVTVKDINEAYAIINSAEFI